MPAETAPVFPRVPVAARVAALAALLSGAPACGASRGGAEVVSGAGAPVEVGPSGSAVLLARDLEAMSGSALAPGVRRATFRAILEDTMAKDAYLCRPSPREVFGGDVPEGVRLISGVMPHYGFFLGPMRYLIRRRDRAWTVEVRIAVDPPEAAAAIELPDCGLATALGNEIQCSGIPYSRSGTTEACPGSGEFRAAATPRVVRALLDRWSREAERYWNRDARAFAIPVTYDFDFVLAAEAQRTGLRVDLTVPLAPTCGRTPYFSAMRTGWSLPVLAHEVGHVMGLLDEYEAFSGIVSAYPKTPFPGAEISRMGLSMFEGTKVLPVHHYLILRRYFCREPLSVDPYTDLLR